MGRSRDIQIYEVGPRDGLQNVLFETSTSDKVDLITSLHKAGFENMEITSFVHPKLVPNMSDAEKVFEQTKHLGDFGVLVPNQRGFERAKSVGAKKFNIFFSPSREFNYRNLGNSNLSEIHWKLQNMLEDVDRENVRAYISCAFGCPFEGKPSEHDLKATAEIADELASDIVLCDTIGSCHPSLMRWTLDKVRKIDADIGLHMHHNSERTNDIFANIKSAFEFGVTKLDSSIGGLGGCPFIPGSGGNLSTNALINWANDNGYETGIELRDLMPATDWVSKFDVIV